MLQALSRVRGAARRKTSEFDRGDWLRYVVWSSVLSAPLFYLLATRYLPHVDVEGARGHFYLASAYVGHFGSLPLVLAVPLASVALLLPSRLVLLPLSVSATTAALALLFVDTLVYGQYRFHLSGFVWELLSGPGAGEMFAFSWFSALVVLGALGAIVMAVFLVSAVALRIVAERRLRGAGKSVLSAWMAAFLSAHSMHAWYEARYDAGIAGVTRHFPLYQPLTAKRALLERGWLDPAAVREENLVRVARDDESLRYPAAPLECRPSEPPPDVLVIAIDAMRADVFSEEVTPELFALTERDDAQHFTEHFSGGNVTKGGLFSLFYGLPATYWDGFAAAGTGAEWIRQHQAAGYRMGVFSSSTLQSPAFDRTVFASVPDLRLKSEGGGPAEKDRASIAALERFVEDAKGEAPWFGFLFLDAVHGYDVPPGYEKFQPQWARVDHVKLNEHFDPEPYFNRYRNALHFLDDSVAAMLKRLSSSGALENTLIVLTSDHGEEFNDLGQNFWGHGSNFSAYQTQVPLLMLWPGKARRTIEHRTSHFDVAPTIMKEALGCTNPMSDHSVGESLFDAEAERDWLIVHSYFNYAVLTDERIITTWPVGGYEIRDLDNRPIVDARLDPRTGAEILRDVSRFYR